MVYEDSTTTSPYKWIPSVVKNSCINNQKSDFRLELSIFWFQIHCFLMSLPVSTLPPPQTTFLRLFLNICDIQVCVVFKPVTFYLISHQSLSSYKKIEKQRVKPMDVMSDLALPSSRSPVKCQIVLTVIEMLQSNDVLR